MHLDLVHKKKDLSKVNANSLLSFGFDDENEKKKKKVEATKIIDEEGIDFGYYFSSRYQMSQVGRRRDTRPQTSDRGGRGRGGRGRGDRTED